MKNMEELKNEKIDNNSEQKITKKRDISIDIIRIIACLIVIACHLTLRTFNEYEMQVDWSRLFTKCFLCDGVGIFFLITGFFIANGRKYSHTLLNTLKKVILPAFLILVFSQAFNEFLTNQASFIDCLNGFDLGDINFILSSIFHGEVTETIPVAAHLWYVYAYIEIIILFPFLQLLCKNTQESNLARRILMTLCVLNVLIKDIQKIITLPYNDLSVFTIIDEKLLVVLFGYELFLAKDRIKNNKKFTLIGFLGFIIINILRYKSESIYMIANHLVNDSAFTNWQCIFGIISAICLFIFVYSIDIKNEMFSKFAKFLSGATFGIYLVHFMLIAKIDIYKFEKISTVKFELLYMFLGTLSIFILSFIIVLIARQIKKFILFLTNKFLFKD